MSAPVIRPHDRDLTYASETSTNTALAVGSVLALLGSIGYIAMNFHSGSPREVYALPLSAATSAIATLGLVILGIGIARWRVDLPAWALTLTSAGLIMTATTSWFFGTGIVAIAEHTNDKTFDDVGMSGWIMAMTLPKMVMCLVGFAALAVAGWRNKALPRLAAAALALGALLSLVPPYPPGVVCAAAGLFLASRARVTR
jgi:hypothetical protein